MRLLTPESIGTPDIDVDFANQDSTKKTFSVVGLQFYQEEFIREILDDVDKETPDGEYDWHGYRIFLGYL